MTLNFKWHRTCNVEWEDGEKDLKVLDNAHCDLREGHAGKHEGYAVMVNGIKHKVYW